MAILGSTSLTGCNSIPDFIGTGSLMMFKQTSAPTSWVKQTVHNDKALRVVDGTVSPGGSISFSSAFPNSTKPISSPVTVGGGTVGNHTLTTTEIPSHTHPRGSSTNPSFANFIGPILTSLPGTGGATGGSGAHSHPFTESSSTFSTTLDLRVQYVDVIICSKS